MRSLTLFIGLAVCAILAGCEKPINLNDLPVSHWADLKTIRADGFGYADGCSVASTQAIVKAGLPYPNYGTRDELAADDDWVIGNWAADRIQGSEGRDTLEGLAGDDMQAQRRAKAHTGHGHLQQPARPGPKRRPVHQDCCARAVRGFQGQVPGLGFMWLNFLSVK